MLRILLADDHKVLRESLRGAFTEAGEEIVGEAANGEEAVELARDTKPDVILMDISMPVLDGIAATQRITTEMPGTKVVVLTMHDDASRDSSGDQRRRRRLPDEGHLVPAGARDAQGGRLG